MDVFNILLYLTLLILGKIIYDKFKNHQFDKMFNKLPGPPKYPLIGTVLPLLEVQRKDRFKVLIKLFEEYKEIGFYRMIYGNFRDVRLFRCDYAEKILKSSKHIEKASTYKLYSAWLGNGLITSSGDHWFTHRRLITPAFNVAFLENFCQIFIENAEILVKFLNEKIELNENEFDICPIITKTTLNIICETSMGIKLKNLPNDDYINALARHNAVITNRFYKPWLLNSFLFQLSSYYKDYYECIDILNKFTANVIRERKLQRETMKNDENGRRKVFLDILLDVVNDNPDFTERDIIEEVNTFMFAGHDTTSVSLSWALYFIGQHPEIQEEIFKETQEILIENDGKLTLNSIEQMKYLERVIKESLRLRTPVPAIGRVLNEDIEIGEYKIPKGTIVTLLLYFIHRDEKYFKDPEKFNPDRFLPENIESRSSFSFVPFSAGLRNCIGQRFALLEEKTIISSIIKNFKITSMQKTEEIHLISETILRPHEGIILKFEKR